MAPKKLKPFRVSYYFADSAVDGKARLWTRYVKAFTAEEAKAHVVTVFAGTPGQLVIVNAYLHYKTPVRAKKAFFVEVPAPAVPLSTILTPAPIVRPDGPCPWHPNVTLEAWPLPGIGLWHLATAFSFTPVESIGSAGGPTDFTPPAQTSEAVESAPAPENSVQATPASPLATGEDLNAVLAEAVETGCDDPNCTFCHGDEEDIEEALENEYRNDVASADLQFLGDPEPAPGRVPKITFVILFFSAAIAVPCLYFGGRTVVHAVLKFLLPGR